MIVRNSLIPTKEQYPLLMIMSNLIGLQGFEGKGNYIDLFLKCIDEPLRFRIESDVTRLNFGAAQVRIDQWLIENIDETYFDFEQIPGLAIDNQVHVDREDDFENDLNINSVSKYSGTYASDIAGLSDDFIDDVLGGDPDAYWNID